MSGALAAVLAAGALLGLACSAVVAARVPRYPLLRDALAALDERTPPSASSGSSTAWRHAGLPLLRRLPVSATAGDLALLGIGQDQFLLAAGARAMTLAAAGPVLVAFVALLDIGLSLVVPAGFTVAGLVVGWTSHSRRVVERAEWARLQLRSALVAYLQQVSLLRRGGAGVSTALALPGRLLTDSWAMRRLGDELELAQLAGEMPWEGLRRFGERIDVDELSDLSAIAEAAGYDGATVVGTLLARAESLRDELLADEHADAHRASGQMSTPGAVQVFLIAAWVLFPAGTALLSSV